MQMFQFFFKLLILVITICLPIATTHAQTAIIPAGKFFKGNFTAAKAIKLIFGNYNNGISQVVSSVEGLKDNYQADSTYQYIFKDKSYTIIVINGYPLYCAAGWAGFALFKKQEDNWLLERYESETVAGNAMGENPQIKVTEKEKGRLALIYKGKNLKYIDFGTSPLKYHTVAKGETLYAIARKYSISVQQLKEWNKRTENNVKMGEKLIINQ